MYTVHCGFLPVLNDLYLNLVNGASVEYRSAYACSIMRMRAAEIEIKTERVAMAMAGASQ